MWSVPAHWSGGARGGSSVRARRSPGSASDFRGFVLFSPPAQVDGITPKGPGERAAGDFRAVPRFLTAAPASASAGSAPAFSRAESRPAAGVRSEAPLGAPPPPCPHCGRGACSAARRRGGDGPERWAGGGRSAGTPLAAARGPSDLVGCAVAAHFLVLRGPEDAVSSGQWRERLPPPGPLCTFSVSRAVGYVEKPGPVRPAPPRAPPPPVVPGALGAPRCGRASRRWAGSPAGAGRPAGAGAPAVVGSGGRTEERRSRFARPRRGP